MIRRMVNKSHVGMVIDNSEEEQDLIFCSTCAANGDVSKLKERIWLDNKWLDNKTGKRLPDPPDTDSWRMCWTCGLIIPAKDIKLSGKISGIPGIEPVDNPYDIGKSTILGNDSKNRYRNLKRQKARHPDSEVQKHIDDGYELTSYFSSMST
jgi:hypothetical protein